MAGRWLRLSRALALTWVTANSGHLANASSPTAVDVCEKPVQAICDAPVPPSVWTPAQARAEVAQSLGGKPLSRLKGETYTDEKAIGDYKQYLNKLNEKLLAQFAKQGVRESDLTARFKQIREKVAGNLEAGIQGGTLKGNAELAAEARKIDWQMVPDSDEETERYYQSCGADGMLEQAYYVRDSNRFFTCPGFLLEALNAGSLSRLDFLMAHEMSHASDAMLWTERFDRYEPFLACVQDRYSKSFESISNVIEQLGDPAQARLKSRLSQLQSLPGDHIAEILDTQEEMRLARLQVERLKTDRNVLKKWKTGNEEPSEALTHASELSADLGAGEAVLSLLRGLPKEQRASSFAHAMREMCPGSLSPAKTAKYGPLKDDAEHPSGNFRIEVLLNHPELRLLLGCQVLTGKEPWCAAGNEATFAGRCNRTQGVLSASQCEQLLSRDLKKAGCQSSGVVCAPGDGKAVDCVWVSPNCQPAISGESPQGLVCLNSRGKKTELWLSGAVARGLCVSATAPSSGTAGGSRGKAGTASGAR